MLFLAIMTKNYSELTPLLVHFSAYLFDWRLHVPGGRFGDVLPNHTQFTHKHKLLPPCIQSLLTRCHGRIHKDPHKRNRRKRDDAYLLPRKQETLETIFMMCLNNNHTLVPATLLLTIY